MQKKFPKYLPRFLRDWNFLPLPLRSLKPYDTFIRRYLCCLKCCRKLVDTDPSNDGQNSQISNDMKKSPPENFIGNNYVYDKPPSIEELEAQAGRRDYGSDANNFGNDNDAFEYKF